LVGLCRSSAVQVDGDQMAVPLVLGGEFEVPSVSYGLIGAFIALRSCRNTDLAAMRSWYRSAEAKPTDARLNQADTFAGSGAAENVE